jgi:High potential iron-sulfur protein
MIANWEILAMNNAPYRSRAQSSAPTRRTVLLGGVACTAGAAALLGHVTDAKAAKVSKASVGYQDSPKGDQQCSNCAQFVPPNACNFVEGDISPSGWCQIWAKKG